MSDFWYAVPESPLARNALVASLLVSVACGVVGSYVVARRITYIAAAISHCILAGLGAARYLNVVYGWDWLSPLHGAFVSAILSGILIGLITLYAREREDTAIGAVWALGMAIGILFIYHTPGYNQDLMSYLFGNILLVNTRDLWLIAALDVVILGVVAVFFERLQAVCFDEEFARLRGLRVQVYYLLLIVLVAITVVLLVSVVGIVLVIALLTLPVAIAGRFATALFPIMALATVLTAVFTMAGLTVSYPLDWPPGPTIILLTAPIYGVTLLRRR